MLVIANPGLLIPRIIMPTLTVATGVGMVVAGITVGLIVGRQISDFENTQIVLETPTVVVLNRFIEPIEVPFFQNVTETMNECINNIKQVLENGFADKFVNIILKNFSSTPTVTSNYTKTLTKREILFTPNSFMDGQSTALDTTDYTTDSLPLNNCAISVTTFYCDKPLNKENKACDYNTSLIYNCTDTTFDILSCVNESVRIYNCSPPIKDRITCDQSSIRIPKNCFSQLSLSITITTSPATTTTAITTPITNNTGSCEPSNDIIGRASIITSKLFIYFKVKQSEPISSEEIIAALAKLKPFITLWTKCLNSSSEASSFNRTLSIVETPQKVTVDTTALANQPSISTELQQSVTAMAETAMQNAGFQPITTSTVLTSSSTTVAPNNSPQIG